ncbi:hypothetical protein [Prosthecomicrobium sp. N25]|uniref:hypothetical protein n=1 Tax=Prosthecomicrobium sp. N25 TaxID=3129254 RepID=UPI003076C8A8
MTLPIPAPARAAAAAALLLALSGPAVAEPVAVDVANRSYATKCAEEDNIYYTLSGADIERFTVVARSPAYLDKVVRDSTAPDFTDCGFGPAPDAPPVKPYVPPTAILHEDDQYIVKGVVYPDFWRPTVVPVKVGKLTQNFLHLVQVWRKTAGGPIEFIVMYPQDGYWRLRPLPPFRMHEVAFGSSFLVGPVEESTRPFVAYKSVEFDPKTLTFTLEFAKGGKGTVRITQVDVGYSSVEVGYAPASDGALPFTAIRSMYVRPDNADTAEAVWRATPGGPAQMQSVIDFKSGKAAEIFFSRSVPSRHNTSSPDVGFTDFRTAK